jgi:hypothetical protein
VIAEPISTRIHAYLPSPQRELFITNAFFYAIGCFATASTSDSHLQLTIEILSLERYAILSFQYSILLSSDTNLHYSRHPGDVSNFDQYQISLPNEWCPMVTIMGMVTSSNTDTGMDFDLHHFKLKTSVYITSTTVEFSVVCYFASGKRWQNLKTPTASSSVSITGKIAD